MSYLHSFNVILTLLICVAIMLVALIRLNCSKQRRARIKYVLVVNAALIGALQPYFPNALFGWGEVALSLSVLCLLIEGASPFSKYKNADYKSYDTQIYDPQLHGDDE